MAATRGASWLEVRAGGADGEELYFGMLEADDTAEFDELPVWVRLGAAETVDLRLDGVQLEPVPADESGVVEILADADGIRPARPTAP